MSGMCQSLRGYDMLLCELHTALRSKTIYGLINAIKFMRNASYSHTRHDVTLSTFNFGLYTEYGVIRLQIRNLNGDSEYVFDSMLQKAKLLYTFDKAW